MQHAEGKSGRKKEDSHGNESCVSKEKKRKIHIISTDKNEEREIHTTVL